MINFIICDSNKHFINDTKKIINNIVPNNYNYKINLYNYYSKELNCMIHNNDIKNKIYILDLEFDEKSGVEIANEIRTNDFESIIIFYTTNMTYDTLFRTPLIFDYISKTDQNKFKNCIQNVLKYLKNDTLYIKNNNIIYNIKFDNILYISTNLENRGVTIVTDTDTINIRRPLNDICCMLNSDFIKTHRACFVNKTRIYKIDFKNREIIFDNNEKINLISIRELKNLKEYF